MAESNFEVDLDELRTAHTALGQVVEVNRQVSATLPRPGSPASTEAPAGSQVASAARAVGAYTALLERLADRQRRGTEAIEETRRRLADAETAYRAADRL